MKTNLMIDITTGDVITYKEVEFKYKTILDNKIIKIMTYNYETILAEKYETILRRNINNTRMKDYYDLFMFGKFKWGNLKKILNDTILNTSLHRNSIDIINNAKDYINLIKNDLSIKKSWNIYKNNYEYAKYIEFEDIIKYIEKLKDCN